MRSQSAREREEEWPMFGSLKKTVAVSLTALTLGLAVAGTATPASADYWRVNYNHNENYGHSDGYNDHGWRCESHYDCRAWRRNPALVYGGSGPAPVGYSSSPAYIGNSQQLGAGAVGFVSQPGSGPFDYYQERGHRHNPVAGSAASAPAASAQAATSAPTNDATAATAPTAGYNAQAPGNGVNSQAAMVDPNAQIPAAGTAGQTPFASNNVQSAAGSNAPVYAPNSPAIAGANAPTVDANAQIYAPISPATAGANAPGVDANGQIYAANGSGVGGNNTQTMAAIAPVGPAAHGANCGLTFKPVFDARGATIGYRALHTCK
jgi:hypothetical protein